MNFVNFLEQLRKDTQIQITCESVTISGFIHSFKFCVPTVFLIVDSDKPKYYSRCPDNNTILIKHAIINKQMDVSCYRSIQRTYINKPNHIQLLPIDNNMMYIRGNYPSYAVEKFEFLPSRNELVSLLNNLTEKLSKNTLNKIKEYL